MELLVIFNTLDIYLGNTTVSAKTRYYMPEIGILTGVFEVGLVRPRVDKLRSLRGPRYKLKTISPRTYAHPSIS
jgi:hypothetical protein